MFSVLVYFTVMFKTLTVTYFILGAKWFNSFNIDMTFSLVLTAEIVFSHFVTLV